MEEEEEEEVEGVEEGVEGDDTTIKAQRIVFYKYHRERNGKQGGGVASERARRHETDLKKT